MARDNISGYQTKSIVLNIFLLPGRAIQWINYMAVGKLGYGQIRQQTRLARSPIMTYVYSFLAWLFIGVLIIDYMGP